MKTEYENLNPKDLKEALEKALNDLPKSSTKIGYIGDGLYQVGDAIGNKQFYDTFNEELNKKVEEYVKEKYEEK